MDVSTRNRINLKSYFVKNAIPTEGNFADLIDAVLNQKDDGLVKIEGNPLSIEAVGGENSAKKVLHFYHSFADAKPDWALSLQSGGNPNRPGFGISDGAGKLRLFIDHGTGNVGIGTTSPEAKLEVKGDLKVANSTSDFANIRFTQPNSGQLEFVGWKEGWNINAKTDGKHLFLNRDAGEKSNVHIGRKKNELFIRGNDGNVGIGTTDPKENLDVNGTTKTTNLLVSGTSAFFGGLSVTGNVKIGTTSSGEKLEVSGGAIQPAAGNSENAGIMFPKDPGKGGGDAAWIRYYVRTDGKEATTLEIGTSNDTDDHIALMASGNVGIGTTSPGTKLDVAGNFRIKNGDNYFSYDGIGDISLYCDDRGKDKDKKTIHTSSHARAIVHGTNDQLVINYANDFTGGVDINGPVKTGVMSGAANDYMKAQFCMTGGGTVTWGGQGGRLKWTRRFIAISMEKPVTFSEGHVEIMQPTSDIPAQQVYDGKARSVNDIGVLLNGWEALYAVHTVGGNKKNVTFRIVKFDDKKINAPSNWILVAVVNKDDGTVKLGTGVILSKNSSSTKSSPIPRGVITMWSGATNNTPDGWVLCNGKNGTPDLQNRFIVAAGSKYEVNDIGGADSVILTTAQMPSHNHSNGNYKYLLQKRSDNKDTTGSTDSSKGEPEVKTCREIQSAGGNQPHENRPPYYALAFIMKL